MADHETTCTCDRNERTLRPRTCIHIRHPEPQARPTLSHFLRHLQYSLHLISPHHRVKVLVDQKLTCIPTICIPIRIPTRILLPSRTFIRTLPLV